MAEMNQVKQPESGKAAESERNRFVDAVVQMTKLTQQGKMRWQSLPSRSGRAEAELPALGLLNRGGYEYEDNRFQTTFKGTRFVLTRFATRGRIPSGVLGVTGRPGWDQTYTLNVLDSNGAVVFTFPAVEALRGLHSSIQDQLADVDKVIQDLFEE